MATAPGISAAARLHAALSRPLYQRCADICKLLEDTSSKELHGIVPTLVESIFSFGSQPGWGIGRIMKSHSYDFAALRQLLHPEGALFSLIYQLMSDPFYRYEFPLTCLPFPVQKMIEDGSIPALFADCLQLNPNGRPYNMLTMNAFEYYFVHFAYFLVNAQSRKAQPWNNPSDALYTVLLEEYLNYFLPPDGSTVPLAPSGVSGMKSPLLAQSPIARHSPSIGRLTPLKGRSPHLNPSLLRTQQKTSSPYGSPINSPVGSAPPEPVELEMWRSQTFLQILVEMWLHQTSIELDKFGYMSSSSRSNYSAWGYHMPLIDPYHYMAVESFLPSADHVRVVRMLVKHLHYFVNSAQADVILSPYSHQTSNTWDDFKKALFPQLVKKKLYGFLKHSFERWPLDASFRLVLETWLSFIQPWRYTDLAQSNREREGDMKDRVIHDKWMGFIVEHLLFYTTLFHNVLQRISRMELSSPRNAHILFRVTKVFGLPTLRDRIEQAESVLFESFHHLQGLASPGGGLHDMGASYLSSPRRHGNVASTLANQFSELEGNGFKYTPLFSDQSIMMIHRLLGLIAQAKETASSSNQSANISTSQSFFSFLGFGSEDYNTQRFYEGENFDEYAGGDIRKVALQLSQSMINLCHVFQLDPPDKPERGVTWGPSPPHSTSSDVLTPAVDDTEEGPKLGPLGRYQLMNGLRKFEIEYQGDPDLQPIRSFESPWLVRVLHHISSYFNAKYEMEFRTLYHRTDFVGRLAQVFLTPPSILSSPEKTKVLSPSAKCKYDGNQRPRISLRWIAQYYNIIILMLMYGLSYVIFGTRPVGFILMMALAALCFASFRAWSRGRERLKES